MSVAEQLANRTVEQSPDLKTFDPMIIAVIIAIIGAIFTVIKNCKTTPQNGLELIQKPKLWHWRKMKRIVRKHAERYDVEAYEALKKIRNTLTIDEVAGLYNEVV